MPSAKCELINTTIPPTDMHLLQEVANALRRRKAHVHALTRYGFSGARIYVIESPLEQKEMPHAVKIANQHDAKEELAGLRVATTNFEKARPYHEHSEHGLTAIYFPLITVQGQGVVDASDIYQECLAGQRPAEHAIVPLPEKTLALMEGAHGCVDVSEERLYGDALKRYTRPRRPSRAKRLFAEGSLDIANETSRTFASRATRQSSCATSWPKNRGGSWAELTTEISI